MKVCKQCENCGSFLRDSCALDVENWELVNGTCEDWESKTIKWDDVDFLHCDLTDEEMDIYL